MDDKRFDSITRLMASGSNRRSLIKGFLGLGGAAVTGRVVLDHDGVEAARRSYPNPETGHLSRPANLQRHQMCLSRWALAVCARERARLLQRPGRDARHPGLFHVL